VIPPPPVPGTPRLVPRDGQGVVVAEKWYSDVLLPNGDIIIVYLLWMRIARVPIARVTAQFLSSDGGSAIGRARASMIRGSGEDLRFGPAEISGRRLRWRTAGLWGELEFAPRYPPATLCHPVFSSGGARIEWSVEIPDADVRGTIAWPGGGMVVEGRGYRDRVFARAVPWRFPLRRLRWGRAYAGEHARIWIEAAWVSDGIAATFDDGRIATGVAEPSALVGQRALLHARLADGMTPLAALRPLCRWLTTDPHQMRWIARSRIGAAEGWAVHEEVRWR
jgi:hypothetical protein